ncbi:MAG: alpha/beta hydrolase [Burkholderiales bacterium]|nr:alpha/beta hydrolase [Burkholderiales bacterium]
MSLKNVFVGCLCACAWAGAFAGSTASAPSAGEAMREISLASNDARPLSRASIAPLEFGHAPYVLPALAGNLNEQVVRIPVDADGTITLEATIYKPDGAGPFPLVVFNHGKIEGDPRAQTRSRPLSFAREFVKRGYAVVAPNREGFADSGGTYRQEGCNVERNGIAQAQDVKATIAYMSAQSYVDASHIVVAGTSHGGLTTIAYGTDAARGVRGLINFSGGLRQDACAGWQDNLTRAFEQYGQTVRLPSLWIYGDNDSVWSPDLTQRMYAAYVAHGAQAKMVDFGDYKNDAHRLVVDRDGVRVWWPAVDAFLERIGMPTHVQYQVKGPALPPASGYAAVDSIRSVPYVDAAGREAYRKFLSQYPTRAFAVSPSGAWSWAEGGDDPMSVALANCSKENGNTPCQLYAVDNEVVWHGKSGASVQTASSNGQEDAPATNVDQPALASRD